MSAPLDYRELLGAADRAARAGGDVVRRYFGRLEAVRQKSPGDWVSASVNQAASRGV